MIVYVYIYIYIYREREREIGSRARPDGEWESGPRMLGK